MIPRDGAVRAVECIGGPFDGHLEHVAFNGNPMLELRSSDGRQHYYFLRRRAPSDLVPDGATCEEWVLRFFYSPPVRWSAH